MFHTARSSARTLLLAAGTAGFVALGAGIAGADTLGGVTDGLPLGDLGNQVPTALTEGVGTPLGDLVKVEPGELSAQPELQPQSAEVQHQSDPVGTVVGDTVSTDTLSTDVPLQTGEDNAADVGPLDLGAASGTLPLSDAGGAVDPVSMLLASLGALGGADSVGGLGGGLPVDAGQTLPLSAADELPLDLDGVTGELGAPAAGETVPTSAPAAPLDLEQGAAVVEDTVAELGSRAEAGLHEPGLDMVGLDDLDVDQLAGTVPMSDPVGLDAGENADLTGGVTTLLPQDVRDTLPMSAPEELEVLGAVGELEVVGAVEEAVSDTIGGLGDVDDAVGVPGADEALPMSGTGSDLVGVQGLPELLAGRLRSVGFCDGVRTRRIAIIHRTFSSGQSSA